MPACRKFSRIERIACLTPVLLIVNIVNFFTKLATNGSGFVRRCRSTGLVGGPAALCFIIAISTSLYAEQTKEQVTKPKRDDTTTIVQMSDPQFFFPDEHRKTDVPTETLAEQAIRYANRLDPDCVVVTGDLVHHTGDKDEIATFWRIFKTLDPKVPLYCVPGNHDVTHKPESIEEYKKQFGKDYYTFQIGEDRFLVLNSVLLRVQDMKSEGAAEQWEWLENELKKAKADKVRHLVVFLHHPLFAVTPSEPEAYRNVRLKNRKRLFHLFEQYGVDAVFAGHFHQNTVNKHHGIDYIVTGSTCAPVVEHDPAGLRVIELGPDGITHRFVKHTDYENECEQQDPSAVGAEVSAE